MTTRKIVQDLLDKHCIIYTKAIVLSIYTGIDYYKSINDDFQLNKYIDEIRFNWGCPVIGNNRFKEFTNELKQIIL